MRVGLVLGAPMSSAAPGLPFTARMQAWLAGQPEGRPLVRAPTGAGPAGERTHRLRCPFSH